MKITTAALVLLLALAARGGADELEQHFATPPDAAPATDPATID